MLRAAVTSPSQCRGSHVRQHSCTTHDIVEEALAPARRRATAAARDRSRDRTPSRTMVCCTVCTHRHSIDRSSATRGSSSRRRSPQRGVAPPHEPSGAASRRRATATANARKGAIACCERACALRAAGVTRNRRRRFESPARLASRAIVDADSRDSVAVMPMQRERSVADDVYTSPSIAAQLHDARSVKALASALATASTTS